VVAEHPAQQFLVAVGQRGHEPRQDGLPVSLAVEHPRHLARRETRLVGDRGVQVRPARLVPFEHTLGVQPGQDRHHGGVRERAADPFPDLARGQRGPGVLQHREHRRL
jgi:hypothetical protein